LSNLTPRKFTRNFKIVPSVAQQADLWQLSHTDPDLEKIVGAAGVYLAKHCFAKVPPTLVKYTLSSLALKEAWNLTQNNPEERCYLLDETLNALASDYRHMISRTRDRLYSELPLSLIPEPALTDLGRPGKIVEPALFASVEESEQDIYRRRLHIDLWNDVLYPSTRRRVQLQLDLPADLAFGPWVNPSTAPLRNAAACTRSGPERSTDFAAG
jgi:hypothetical protein